MTTSSPDAVRRLRDDVVGRGLVAGLPAAFLAGITRFGQPPRAELDALAAEVDGLAGRLASGAVHGGDLPLLTRVLYLAGQADLLAVHGVLSPMYDLLGGFRDNLARPLGPRQPGRPTAGTRRWPLLGRRIGFPIGVPACVLNGSEAWVRHNVANGWNVLTYKTVRGRAHPPNEQPNWVFAARETASLPPGADADVVADPWDWVPPGSPEVSSVNSFGVPSPEPEEWMADLERALQAVGDEQLLLVSVMGEDADGTGRVADLAADFARTALMAQEAGASVVELNLSCPNTLDRTASGVKPPLCLDPGATVTVVDTVRRALDDRTGLVAKLSWLDEPRLSALVPELASLVDGIAGINTVQSRVRRRDGTPTFPGRELAGLSGIAVREPALDFTRRLVALRDAGGAPFDVLAMGGVTDTASFEALFGLGADAVQSAAGAFADPFLAAACVAELGTTLPRAVEAP
ncbi:Dihydroorotate dehydrogenase [Blastococcus aurantiacus]|uniref:Dihydroorotate dehydrogenase n=1 Tax=Blastococcus aurantiacus TaxID=1550231 RepID=A0A1G7P758_9ACTN|nr:dihydroorotate oxidase [Blastococcus aurantiacus]SDF82125.1 Dihydroorotate dehydrogenase [Blastococcus aurantiacus]